ncbi:sensor histidine kinase [Alienimonas californiensis]|uniref:histidine kinase n=1 Tax=Alienimonas californiensis TaxID=2527989 RepID=A0A517PCC1_9PLAN|nr:HAMP domain-containing sensor histidine kinase [Alienimonas californiensis]QDT17037.1 Sensor protein ZraS [Alienimonas californiensis]
MFFARSLRLRLYGGVALAAAMLVLLSGAALVTLNQSHQATREIYARLTNLPNRAALDRAVDNLQAHTLPQNAPPTREVAEGLQREVRGLLAAAEQARVMMIRDYDAAPLGSPQRGQWVVAGPVLGTIGNRFNSMAAVANVLVPPSGQEFDRKKTDAARAELFRLAVLSKSELHAIPDPHVNLHRSLSQHHRHHRRLLLWVIGLTALVVLGCGWLVYYGYRRLGVPLRDLHRSARQIAGGDVGHRVKQWYNDEVGELVGAVNHMADRFSEMNEELDRRVYEQSRQLVRSERLAGVGTLSAGLAHEINNPLSAIGMAAQSLTQRSASLLSGCSAQERALAERYLEMIARETDRCSGITRKLLTFAKGNGGVREPTDVRTLAEEVLEMVRPMSKYADRRVEFDPGPAGCVGVAATGAGGPEDRAGGSIAHVNGPEIKQVLLNLTLNALEATPDGGAVTLRVRPGADAVEVSVEDTGCGMTDEVREHLFEPFFTRRGDGTGTGLGLSMTHRIVTDHGGTIEADSDGEGRGSVFRVRLPRQVAEPARRPLRKAA